MRILITNTSMDLPGGTEGTVCDLALAWKKQGKHPMVFSPRLGMLADELSRQGITVTDNLESIPAPPDLIHGQHNLESMMAVQYFPDTPALFHCHGWQPWQEKPPIHPRILLYLAIGERTKNFVLEHTGCRIDDIRVIPNYVDIDRFSVARTPPERLSRALIYNRYLNPEEVGVIVAACTAAGIACDTFSSLNPPIRNPEEVLPRYDLIFAVGKSAIEAIASGAAVILCSGNAMGAMVTADNITSWRNRNFTASFDRIPVTGELVSRELAKYDARSTAGACAFVREHCSLKRYLVAIDEAHAALLRRAGSSGKADGNEIRRAEYRHAQEAGMLAHNFSAEAHGQRQRADELDAAFVKLRDEHARVTIERDIAVAQRAAMANTLVWRLREGLLRIPLAGTLLDRLGKILGKPRG